METPKYDNLILNQPNYIKGFCEKSASTISDCYSSDDDYKEGILQDYLLNQSSVLLSHESVAFNGDQRDCKSNLNFVENNQNENNQSFENNCSNYWKRLNNHILSLSNSNIPENWNFGSKSPDFFHEKCISEFYRPPSRSKDSFVGDKQNMEDNASILVHHYIDTGNGVSYLNSVDGKEADVDNDISVSLFKQCKDNNSDLLEDSTIKLISTGSLNSRTQSDSIIIPKPSASNHDVFLDYEFGPVNHTELDSFSFPSSLKKNDSIRIKSTTQSSEKVLSDRFTQTLFKYLSNEKSMETNYFLELNYPTAESSGDCKTSICYMTSDCQDLDNNVSNLPSILAILQQHIDNIANLSENFEFLSTVDELDTKQQSELIESKSNEIYSHRLVRDLYRQLRHMIYKLNVKFHISSRDKMSMNHQRRFSEVVRNRDFVYGSGDVWSSSDSGIGIHENRIKSLPPAPPVMLKSTAVESTNLCESESVCIQNSNQRSTTCRVFELNPYDDLIKSYQSHTDRRIKAVGHKMKCQITIDGPIRIYDSTNSCWNMRNKTAYRCSLNGNTKEAVEKCLKCLQDTFPQSCLNEKHTVSKSDNKHAVS